MTTQAADSQPATSTFEIQRLYVKEQSCKVPHAPNIYFDEWKPEIQMELNLKQETLQNQLFEVVLRINITAKNNQRTAFILEVQQAGIFKIAGFNEQQLPSLLNAFCPNILYPYARQIIADATMQAGFPPLQITPINFDAVMQQQKNAETV